MTHFRMFVLCLALGLVGQQPGPPECPESSKPWMCGVEEWACSRDGHPLDGDDTKNWSACQCQHACDSEDPNADETGGRKWDAKCKTRCKTDHCHCAPNKCIDTNQQQHH